MLSLPYFSLFSSLDLGLASQSGLPSAGPASLWLPVVDSACAFFAILAVVFSRFTGYCVVLSKKSKMALLDSISDYLLIQKYVTKR